jgi:hypothetical protein
VPPPTADATRPPGVAHGWDGIRPPKNDDNGNHTGWTNNSVPADEPSADEPSADEPPADEPPAALPPPPAQAGGTERIVGT